MRKHKKYSRYESGSDDTTSTGTSSGSESSSTSERKRRKRKKESDHSRDHSRDHHKKKEKRQEKKHKKRKELHKRKKTKKEKKKRDKVAEKSHSHTQGSTSIASTFGPHPPTSSTPDNPTTKPEIAKRSLAPMTKEEYDKLQSVLRRVVDPETGRSRLVKGDGEIMEEIVSRERHKAINKLATQGDGYSFQVGLRKLT